MFGRRATDVAAYLRRNDMTVTAWPDGITVDQPICAPAILVQRSAEAPARLTQKNEIGWG
jgi:hypothetical protein